MKRYLILIIRLTIAIILLQTLWYKFTAQPESVYLFSKMGLEPYGRIGVGILELIASILLMVSKTVWQGALLSFVLMIGAVFMHLNKLGIEINDDRGKLFYMAITVLVLSFILLLIYRKTIPFINKLF